MNSRVTLTHLVTEPLENNVFIVQCAVTGESVLIDAAGEPGRLIDAASLTNVRKVLTTHGHWDHVGAIPQMRAAGYPVGIGAPDTDLITEWDFEISDGDIFEVGELRIEAIATPGHTAGSVCFFVHDTSMLFTGDTLFPGGPGATHFPGGDYDTIIKSIDEKLYARFDAETIVLPGHGLTTVLSNTHPPAT